ncbi:hypothetical protein J6590_029452 [Homalodisca vitripennis]|nr:hypothetical protein J6590_029452 [Homalodisca vitripennis]
MVDHGAASICDNIAIPFIVIAPLTSKNKVRAASVRPNRRNEVWNSFEIVPISMLTRSDGMYADKSKQVLKSGTALIINQLTLITENDCQCRRNSLNAKGFSSLKTREDFIPPPPPPGKVTRQSSVRYASSVIPTGASPWNMIASLSITIREYVQKDKERKLVGSIERQNEQRQQTRYSRGGSISYITAVTVARLVFTRYWPRAIGKDVAPY